MENDDTWIKKKENHDGFITFFFSRILFVRIAHGKGYWLTRVINFCPLPKKWSGENQYIIKNSTTSPLVTFKICSVFNFLLIHVLWASDSFEYHDFFF